MTKCNKSSWQKWVDLLISETISNENTCESNPHESMISEIDDEGLPLCIDSQASIHFPPGDVVASYLLDYKRRQNQIFTFHATQPRRKLSELARI